MSVLSYFMGTESNKVTHWFAKPFSFNKAKANKGRVYLIGAGPGDPELITVKAQRLIESADVILYDWLISVELLRTLPENAQRVFVGKRANKHSMQQAEISKLLVKYAQQGHTVVRLKGGDPSIFARVNEEADALAEHNIPFAIVPGVTTACAASAYTGIPLTARGVARSVTFMTAQFADPKQQPKWYNYQYLSNQDNPTLVVYMGLGRLQQLSQGLQSVGWPATTPIALLEQVATASQQVIRGTLENITQKSTAAKLTGPTLIMIGEVINHQMAIEQQLLNITATQV